MKRKIDSMTDIHKHLKVDFLMEAKDLPVEILVYIFKFLSPSKRRALLSVCKKWLHIGSDFFVRDSCIMLTKPSIYTKMSSLLSVFGNKDVADNRRNFCLLIRYDDDEKTNLMNFIELVGTKIKHLKFTKDPDDDEHDWHREFFNWIDDDMDFKLPNLETLEIEAKFFEPYSLPMSLREIKIIGRINIKTIHCIKANEHVEKLTCDFLELHTIEKFSSADTMIFSDELLSVIKDTKMSRMQSAHLQIRDFNFCTSNKLTCADVTGLEIKFAGKIMNPIIYFPNLKEFTFQYSLNENNIEELFGHNVFTHIGVTKLIMINARNPQHLHFLGLLECFPSLEHLEVYDNPCNPIVFSNICQKFPKLKSLTLKARASQFSVENLFGQDSTTFGLKDLKNLETLKLGGMTINQAQDIDITAYQWPNLPNLSELRFYFYDLNNLQVDQLIKSIPNGSPNISKFELNLNHSYVCTEDYIPFISAWGKNLTELSITGDIETKNEILIQNILENCTKIEKLSYRYIPEFSLIQEATLFAQLPSLESIKFYINSTDYLERTRKDFVLLTRYIKQHLN